MSNPYIEAAAKIAPCKCRREFNALWGDRVHMGGCPALLQPAIAEALARVVREEREACAKIVDSEKQYWAGYTHKLLDALQGHIRSRRTP